MDFFAREERAQRTSRRLIWMFILAVVITVLALNLLATWAVDAYVYNQRNDFRHQETPLSAADEQTLRTEVYAIVTLATLLIIVLGSVWKTRQLSGGGAVVAGMLGGRWVDRGTRDARERMLVNVVEEMSIASGVPMPQVFILPDENGINAFAAGHGTGDAVVAVTAGCLKRLNRDELQGVIGHEFSHILNGDMRLNLRLIGMVHGILIIALTGRMLLRLANSGSNGSSKRGGGGLYFLIIGLGMLVIGYIGYFFGELIKAAVSRQRELLADASSVQFTRNPDGLGSALKKLGSRYSGAYVHHAHTHELSHLFFGNAVGGVWLDLLATHPPLEERIRAIDPRWDGAFPVLTDDAVDERYRTPAPAANPAHARIGGAEFIKGAVLAAATAARSVPIQAEAIAGRVATVSPDHVDFGAALLARIPAELIDATRQPFSARAVIFALLLDPAPAKAAAQLDLLAHGDDPTVCAETRRLRAPIAGLGEGARLPLLDLSVPTLRQLSAKQRQAFLTNLRLLARAGSEVSLAEFCLAKLIETHLAQTPVASGQVYSLLPLLPHLSVLLSALARAGQASDQEAARRAFAVACSKLLLAGEKLELLPSEACGAPSLDEALAGLNQASPGIRRRILTACAWCVAADGAVTVREAELLRVIADCLGCPLPPFAGAPA